MISKHKPLVHENLSDFYHFFQVKYKEASAANYTNDTPTGRVSGGSHAIGVREELLAGTKYNIIVVAYNGITGGDGRGSVEYTASTGMSIKFILVQFDYGSSLRLIRRRNNIAL